MIVRFIDLFCGTGGIRLGMEMAFHEKGYDTSCIKSAEIDIKAAETYFLNFGDDSLFDVRDINDLEPFDVLLAGLS